MDRAKMDELKDTLEWKEEMLDKQRANQAALRAQIQDLESELQQMRLTQTSGGDLRGETDLDVDFHVDLESPQLSDVGEEDFDFDLDLPS